MDFMRPSSAAPDGNAQGKSIVVIGGGTGNYTTLSELRNQDCHPTAVVAMTDSGGSSGKLREELGQLPYGDLRRCLLALAPDDPEGNLMRRLFDYRFSSGNGLKGHSFGNLMLTVLTEVTGSTITAVEQPARLLDVKGQVLPVTLTRSALMARLEDGTDLSGESDIDLRQDKLNVRIDYAWLEPKAFVYPPVLDAIECADVIVFGPGDIYTSVLPNLLVDDMAEAINVSRAVKVHVCNLMTKPAESAGFKASSFVKLVQEYLGTTEPLDYLIFNNSPFPKRLLQRYAADGQYPVELGREECFSFVREVLCRPLLAAGSFRATTPMPWAGSLLRY